jgi:hypothetical protein
LTTVSAYANIEVVREREQGKMPQFSPQVLQLAKAISVAEGSPPEWNNPGDLTGTDAGSFATNGTGNLEGVWRFCNAVDGWMALWVKVDRMLSGKSRVYPLHFTLEDVGRIYSGGDPNWARNVAAYMRVPITITLAQLAQTDV